MSGKSSEPVNVSSPGAQLCKARERAGVTLQYVAEQTLIPILKLQALERDDYSAVGGTAHVTGYTRAYGRVLGIEVDPLVKEIELALGVEQTRVDTEHSLGLNYSSSKSPLIYVLIIAIVVILIGLWVGLKIFSGSEKPVNVLPVSATMNATQELSAQQVPSINVTEVNSVQDQGSAPASTGEVTDEFSAVNKDIQASAADDDMDMPAQANSGAAVNVQRIGETATNGEAQKKIEKRVGGADLEPNSFATSAQVNGAEKNVTKPNLDSPMRDQLVFSFNADCWLNVSDASKKTLVSSLVKAGETLEVKGVAPFQVHLGNATAVSKIAFNQQPVQFSLQPGQRTLRLTIGG